MENIEVSGVRCRRRCQQGGGLENVKGAARWFGGLIGPSVHHLIRQAGGRIRPPIQRGQGLDIQKWLTKTGRELH